MNTSACYPFAKVEADAQLRWANSHTFIAQENQPGDKFYCLSMFPYPSGKLHMGHMRNYTIGDMIARHRRMLGQNVLQPLGWDAFGLPAENAAIDNNIPPAKWTYDNIDDMRTQLKRLGLAIDWRREFATCAPTYYRWEQQLFVRLFNQGIIYKKKATVNWDPVDNTVLANEQVVDGCGWRSGAPVQRREIPMYFMKITQYADELLDELDSLPGWPESVKTMQKNWIGRSTGVRVFFAIAEQNETLECWSTRPDTLFGATFCAIAPEHPLATKCAKNNPQLATFIADCRHLAINEEALEKTAKRGYHTGLYAVHPFDNSRQLPIYVANFILMQYGTGAIYGCPAHDQRDLDFARDKQLPIIPVVLPDGQSADTFTITDTAYTGGGTMFNSDFMNDMPQPSAIEHAIKKLEDIGCGKRELQYRLRDWGVSRQRYWGCPIPIIHCQQCGDVAAAESDLPVLLPEDATIDGRGSPLAKMDSFTACRCPQCQQPARRETDTFDTFFESSWYFARFASYDCADRMIDQRAAYWMPVNQYVGGIEHACLHLLYARFFHKLMRDANMYPQQNKRYNEPFQNLLCQGMVLNHAYYRTDNGARTWLSPANITPTSDAKGKIIGGIDVAGNTVHYAGRVKMSKSANNGIAPENIIAEYGADTARLFILFAAPPEQSLEWSDEGVRGCARFLNRLWISLLGAEQPNHSSTGLKQWRESLQHSSQNADNDDSANIQKQIAAVRLRLHQLLKKADYDMNRLRFNNIPSAAMSMVGELNKNIVDWVANAQGEAAAEAEKLLTEGFSIVLRVLAPAVPHITQELWQQLHLGKTLNMSETIADAPWPTADVGVLAAKQETTIIAQINGKRRAEFVIDSAATQTAAEQAARQLPVIAQALQNNTIRKVIFIPKRVINFVISSANS